MKYPEQKLFMLLLGCKPKGRLIEQHDIFFGIGSSINELVPFIKESWAEPDMKIHIDAWREVKVVGDYDIIIEENTREKTNNGRGLFFLNLGGYIENQFEEFHHKMLVVAESSGAAIREAKETIFYKKTGFDGAMSHIDDKYGIDVDDIYQVEDILLPHFKRNRRIVIQSREDQTPCTQDEIRLGYFKLEIFCE